MISVCLATYNGEKFIKKQLDSILCQLSENDEIIISDDGSKDDTLKIIQEINDKRIKIFNHEHKINSVYPDKKIASIMFNFENSLKNANGDYIFLSDQDDIWREDKVKKSVELLQKYDLVISNFNLIDENDNETNPLYYKKSPIKKFLINHLIDSPFLGCGMAFTKKVKDKSLPMPESVCIHDFWIGLVAWKIGKTYYEMEPLFSHRLSSINSSTFARKSTNSFKFKLQYRFNIFIEYIKLKKN